MNANEFWCAGAREYDDMAGGAAVSRGSTVGLHTIAAARAVQFATAGVRGRAGIEWWHASVRARSDRRICTNHDPALNQLSVNAHPNTTHPHPRTSHAPTPPAHAAKGKRAKGRGRLAGAADIGSCFHLPLNVVRDLLRCRPQSFSHAINAPFPRPSDQVRGARPTQVGARRPGFPLTGTVPMVVAVRSPAITGFGSHQGAGRRSPLLTPSPLPLPQPPRCSPRQGFPVQVHLDGTHTFN